MTYFSLWNETEKTNFAHAFSKADAMLTPQCNQLNVRCHSNDSGIPYIIHRERERDTDTMD